ncbi:hypothetical protein SCLCIDRAFT_1220237 [Scleroderma citrinum Foug A]|uniref:Uncharacterized protein n=1 Tax=Scleroderma citrinum Foug A TaxID=1036808 RepID=A0A0C3DJP1_9AGAM|nr:hypothetical protein SCLCIDRAFT_1220237 [Scleroderma citrinum Foug A]
MPTLQNLGTSLRDSRDIFLTSRASETMNLGSLIDRWTSLALHHYNHRRVRILPSRLSAVPSQEVR